MLFFVVKYRTCLEIRNCKAFGHDIWEERTRVSLPIACSFLVKGQTQVDSWDSGKVTVLFEQTSRKYDKQGNFYLSFMKKMIDLALK